MLAGVGKIGRIGGAGSGSAGLTGFVSVWATTAINETITIPTQAGAFNAVVDWGDSSPPETITSSTGFVHTYATAGDHTISITGQFPNIYFNNGGDKAKIKKVLNLGTVGWTRFDNAFFGCNALTDFTVGTADSSLVNNMLRMFQSCTSLTSLNLSALDTSSVNNVATMFYNCTSLETIDVSGLDTALVSNMSAVFRDCISATSIVGVEDWDITGLNSTGDLTNFLTVGSMTTAQYDALLVKWRAQDPFNGMTPSFGASTYTGGSAAATARQDLIDIDGWSISDGGIAP